MKYLAGIVIWFLFWVAGIVAPLIAVIRALLTWNADPISNAFHAQNRVAATVLGFEGKYTISTEWGLRLKTCAFCRRVCAMLSWVLRHPMHCDENAVNKR